MLRVLALVIFPGDSAFCVPGTEVSPWLEALGIASKNPGPNPRKEWRQSTLNSKHQRGGIRHNSGEGYTRM